MEWLAGIPSFLFKWFTPSASPQAKPNTEAQTEAAPPCPRSWPSLEVPEAEEAGISFNPLSLLPEEDVLETGSDRPVHFHSGFKVPEYPQGLVPDYASPVSGDVHDPSGYHSPPRYLHHSCTSPWC